MGFFITFEGVEGCGKSTQIRLLAERLAAHGFDALLTREPGGCAISDKIRAILLDANNQAMSPLTELFLYSAARAQHVSEVIHPALKESRTVLCDRFCDATLAYQCFGRGLDRTTTDLLNTHACQGLVPDLTILIDLDPSIGLERARRRIEATSGPREERFELEALSFHHRVREGYLQLAEMEADRFVIIDGNDTPENISTLIEAKALARIPEKFHAVC